MSNVSLIGEPWFKHCNEAVIDRFIEAVHKVAENYRELLGEKDEGRQDGNIALTHRKK